MNITNKWKLIGTINDNYHRECFYILKDLKIKICLDRKNDTEIFKYIHAYVFDEKNRMWNIFSEVEVFSIDTIEQKKIEIMEIIEKVMDIK